MAGPRGTPLCLALIVCWLAGTYGQRFAGEGFAGPAVSSRHTFSLYFVGMDFGENGADLSNATSQKYMMAKQEIGEAFSPMGGYLDDLTFGNGDPCVYAIVSWVDTDDATFLQVQERMKMSGITLLGQDWMISFTGCSPDVHLLTFSIYVSGLTWVDTMDDQSSSEYAEIRQQVEAHFSDLGGQIRTMLLSDNNGCVHVFVEWDAYSPRNIIRLTSELKNSGFRSGNEVLPVSTRPCLPSDVAADDCPPVPAGTFGICVQECSDTDPSMGCQEGYKCCGNGCGKVCVRVGYKVRVTAMVVVDARLEDYMMDPQSTQFMAIQQLVDLAVKGLFNTGPEPLVVGAELVKFMNSVHQRQVYATMLVDIYLAEEVPNNEMMDALSQLEGMAIPVAGIASPVDSQGIRLLAAGFSNHSTLDMTSCGGIMCHGICKHLITGEDYCSCDEGRMGPGCIAFDCRSDVSSFAPAEVANICEQGRCELDEDDGSYQCTCNSGYYGDVCNVDVCDLLQQPCGQHGTCLGRLEEGMLCRCDQGWGGIFCNQTSVDENQMSRCEKERRLMQYVHQQVHSRTVAPPLKTFMTGVLERMGTDWYSIPYCWAPGSGRDGEYHSMCHYNSETGKWGMCECLSDLRESNGYTYFSEGDCRVFQSGQSNTVWYTDKFYMTGLMWSEDMIMDSSEVFMSIKEQIMSAAQVLSGGVTHVELSQEDEDCVMVVVNWYSTEPNAGGRLSMRLASSGMSVDGQTKRISQSGCMATGGDFHLLNIQFYVSGLPTPRDVTDHSSDFYRMAQAAVRAAFSDLGGKMRTLAMAENNGCVHFLVEWEAMSPNGIMYIMPELTRSGLVVGSTTYAVQNRPCLPTDGAPEGCPSVLPGSVGICVEMCGEDKPCGEGFKCCSNGCGHTCVRVGYKVKVTAKVTLDLPMNDYIFDSSSSMYSIIKQGADIKVKEAFNLRQESTVVATDLRETRSMVHGDREYPVLVVDIFLADDYPNERLIESVYLLETSKLSILGIGYDFLKMEFSNHSIDGMYCGGVKCNGICKSFFSGGDFCSCDAGKRGDSCSVFDCRLDLTQFVAPNSHCQNGGSCSMDIHSRGFMCECEPGFYGDACEVNVCSMLDNPCSSKGYCLGRVEEGMLCQCDQGWGGMFCEKDTPDDAEMSTCEKERRVMMFVHEQITGQTPRSPRLGTFMSTILQRMKSPHYPVPFCWPDDPGSPNSRGYSTICYYESDTGREAICECVDLNGEGNEKIYFGDGDCRNQTGSLEFTNDFFYVSVSKNASIKIHDELKEQVAKVIQNLGGRLNGMVTNLVKNGCVQVQVSWSWNGGSESMLVDKLMDTGLDIGGQNMQVSKDMCTMQLDINSCPAAVGGTQPFMPCPPSCSNDTECGQDSKCCWHSCGASTCTEVGFLDKITVNVTVEMSWDPQLAVETSIMFRIIKTAVEQGIDEEMVARGIAGYKSSTILGFHPVSVNTTSSRRRRQVPEMVRVIIEMKFTESLPVESLLELKSDLVENGLNVMDTVYNIADLQFVGSERNTNGSLPPCGFEICAPGSLCVQKVGGAMRCACPEGRSGSGCHRRDCMVDGTSVCHNSGSCMEIDDSGEGGSYCVCQPGYYGELCEARLCDYLNNTACGSGTCAADINAPSFCRCPPGTGGLFCETSTPDASTMTTCQKAKRMTEYIRQVWLGLESNNRIKDVNGLLATLVGNDGRLAVPRCWGPGSRNEGAFHSRCLYGLTSKVVETCICTDEDGEPNFWDYDYETGQCRVYSNDCENIVCHNGGSCMDMPGGRSYCDCPAGFSGWNCQNREEERCPNGAQPLQTDEGDLQCRTAACPYGFTCNAEAGDRWTACCFDEEFLCRENPCQAGGKCLGNLMNGRLCMCPQGTGGVLCEKSMPDGNLTACQTNQRFMDMIISILKGEPSPVQGLTIGNLRRILIHNQMEWLPENSCDLQGNFKTMANFVHVLNPTAGNNKMMCMDGQGIPDPTCRRSTCDMLSMSGTMEPCMNGGRCVGAIRGPLCDCRGTGFHGIRCQIPGAPRNETRCSLQRDIAKYALDVLHSATESAAVKDALKKIIKIHGSEDGGVFVPSCDAMGRFEFKGCVHAPVEGKMATCYCATQDGQMVGDEVRLLEPPEDCDGSGPGPDKGDCPMEWGKECIKPMWWCSNEMRCMRSEKCAEVADTNGKMFKCVPKETLLPCDHRPCKDNPYAQCSPCGRRGKCYNKMMGDDSMSDEDSSEEDKDRRDYSMRDMVSPNMGREMPDQSTTGTIRSPHMGYTCSCSIGYSGDHCDINTEICNTVPDSLCDHGCHGDIDQGYLCRCPEGMGGIFCKKQVRSECERRKALYDDAIEIMTDKMMVEGYDMEQFKDLILVLVSIEGGDEIPKLNCSNTGLYAKIQCGLNLNSMTEYCFCADQQGEYISSNVEPYINFDVCTANGDMRQVQRYLCDATNPVSSHLCLNGGTCLLDVYNGHLCDCPEGYSGAFCEVNSRAPEEPRSLCEFMVNAFDSIQDIVAGTVKVTDEQKAIMINVTYSFLFPYMNGQFYLKPECSQDGAFNSAGVCYHDIRTGEKGRCFCWGSNGPDMDRPVMEGEDPDVECGAAEPKCSDKIKEKCPMLKCAGGYRTDINGCPVCECKHPCEHLKCKRGERCQLNQRQCHKHVMRMSSDMPGHMEDKHDMGGMGRTGNMYGDKDDMEHDMHDDMEHGMHDDMEHGMYDDMEHDMYDDMGDMDDMEKCAMCVPIHKPGVCPDHNVEAFGSIIGGGLGFDDFAMGVGSEDGSDDDDDAAKESDDNDSAMKSECPQTCRDDADCPGKKKCCGLCGSKCVDPVETFSCSEEAAKMNAYAAFLQSVADALVQSQSQAERLNSGTLATLERVTSVPNIWLPDCETDGYLFKPLQCEFPVAELNQRIAPRPSHCFCVDRLGTRLPGSEEADPSDPEACQTKPGVCPYLTPTEDSADQSMLSCSSDVDCLGKSKCCSNGVGMVCAEAVPKPPMALTDRLMASLCKINSSLCNGNCEGNWEEEGEACRCRGTAYGPFCQQQIAAGTQRPRTSCQRKFAARKVFETNFYNAERDPQGIVLLTETYMRMMYETMGDQYNWEEEEITMVEVECTQEGEFAPMQCVREVRSWAEVACYCVDRDGKELVGTRMPAHKGRPHCGGEGFRSCPVGYPLHNSDGNMLQCGENVDRCPEGYTCTRGAYGQQHCCLTKEGVRDVCHQHVDVGMTCPRGTRDVPGTRFYFNGKECVQFQYKGCGGNKNMFMTVRDCEARCKQNVHKGTCPARPFRVNVQDGDCQHKCREDKDCEATHKCCRSTCGMRCFPAIDTDDSERMCPYGQAQMECSPTSSCPAGHYCKSGSQPGAGVCCVDYNNMNACSVPPQNNADCFDRLPRYFYNASSKTCEKFLYSGCDPQFNNFHTLEACCEACNGEGRCKTGRCPAVRPGSAISCQDECKADGQCSGGKICCSNGCARVCMVPQAELPTDCWERRNAALKRHNVVQTRRSNQCNLVDVPECDASGFWSRQQCHKAIGLCWCVTPMGHLVPNTMSHGPAPCDRLTEYDIARADQQQLDPATAQPDVCPAGEELHCCDASLCERSCRAYPGATCRINPCGGCMAEYFLGDRRVECFRGLSKCNEELKEASTAIQERRITAKMAAGGHDDMDDDMMEKHRDQQTSMPRSFRMDIPLRCQFPRATGPCKGFLRQWYYNPIMGACSMFVWGMCQGNDNRFESPAECYDTCNKKADPCMNVTCPIGEMCQYEFDEDCYASQDMCMVTAKCEKMESPNMVSGIYVPRCLAAAGYSHKQCHDGYCWCVDQDGQYVDGLTTRGTHLTCTADGMTADSVIEIEACPNGRKLNVSCVKACTKQVCPGNPRAHCKADLCAEDCGVMFVDDDDATVSCSDNKCDVFKFEEDEDEDEDRAECSAPKLQCNTTSVRHCPESVCHEAQSSCAKNPCAVCSVDPCNCRPYFVDALSGDMLSQDDCNYINLGVCDAKKCNVMNLRANARLSGLSLNDSDLALPDCDEEGRFRVEQCNGLACVCVNEFGLSTGPEADGSCRPIDPVAKIQMTLTYGGSLRELREQNKVADFKNAILRKLEENGINPANLKLGDLYEGSVKMDVEVVESPADNQGPRQNLALLGNALRQAVAAGNLNINVGGQSYELEPEKTIVTPRTASQVAQEATTTPVPGTTSSAAPPVKDDGDSGLSKTEKIIIGAVCGAVGLLILIIICYCCCCRRKTKETPPDDTFDHVRVAHTARDNTYDKPALYNPTFEEEGHYMKVKL